MEMFVLYILLGFLFVALLVILVTFFMLRHNWIPNPWDHIDDEG